MSRMTCRARLVGMITVAMCCVSLSAQTQMSEEAQSLYERMTTAYLNTNTYQATVELIKSEYGGRWQLMQQLQVAYDRSSGSLLIDRPDMLLVSSEGILRYRSDMIPGRHLQVRLNKPVDDQTLGHQAPFLARQLMPDVRLLLGGKIFKSSTQVKALDADKKGRPGLQWASPEGLVTLRVNPKTALIEQALIERPARVQRASHLGPATYSYNITLNRHNEQFLQEWFAFDTSNSQPVKSWSSLLGSNDVDATAMQQQLAPSISLSDTQHNMYLLEREEADVLVLTFWASWGGPPVYQVLPVLQRLSDWAEQQGKSVAVKTVNMQEDAKTIQQVWEVKQLTLPVLMDVNAQAAHAYRVGAVPQTVVIANGMVRYVQVGMPSDFETVLRAQVNALLEKPVSVTRK